MAIGNDAADARGDQLACRGLRRWEAPAAFDHVIISSLKGSSVVYKIREAVRLTSLDLDVGIIVSYHGFANRVSQTDEVLIVLICRFETDNGRNYAFRL